MDDEARRWRSTRRGAYPSPVARFPDEPERDAPEQPAQEARPDGKAVAAALARGEPVTDETFDQLLPSTMRKAAASHWTPLAAAKLAARWLCNGRYARVLDVGSGAGKFCVVAALTQKGRFQGAELRPTLVEAANALAAETGAERAKFHLGDALTLDWSVFNGLFLYNPFAELLCKPDRRIAPDLDGGPDEYRQSVRTTQLKLADLEGGTRVVTFHGFGGLFPGGYRRIASEWVESGPLELWLREDRIELGPQVA